MIHETDFINFYVKPGVEDRAVTSCTPTVILETVQVFVDIIQPVCFFSHFCSCKPRNGATKESSLPSAVFWFIANENVCSNFDCY